MWTHEEVLTWISLLGNQNISYYLNLVQSFAKFPENDQKGWATFRWVSWPSGYLPLSHPYRRLQSAWDSLYVRGWGVLLDCTHIISTLTAQSKLRASLRGVVLFREAGRLTANQMVAGLIFRSVLKVPCVKCTVITRVQYIVAAAFQESFKGKSEPFYISGYRGVWGVIWVKW